MFVLGLFKIGRELELDGLLLLLLLLLLLIHLMITGLLLTARGLVGLLLIVTLLLFGKYVRLTDVRPSETENKLDLLELE